MTPRARTSTRERPAKPQPNATRPTREPQLNHREKCGKSPDWPKRPGFYGYMREGWDIKSRLPVCNRPAGHEAQSNDESLRAHREIDPKTFQVKCEWPA